MNYSNYLVIFLLFGLCSSLNNTNSTIVTTFNILKYKQKLDFDMGVFNSFIQSFILIFISEIADKTFIIIMIFSTKRKNISTFFAALAAILFMNYVAIFIGYSADILLYEDVIHWGAIIILIIYGYSIFTDALEMSTKKVEDQYFTIIEDEYIQRRKEKKNKRKEKERIKRELSLNVIQEADNGLEDESKLNEPMLPKADEEISVTTKNCYSKIDNNNNNNEEHEENNVHFIWIMITSIMAAECGDRSQISTIIISSVFNRYGVLIGSSSALIISVYINVYFGHQIAVYLSEKQINIICGILLFSFGIEILLIKLNYLKFD